MPPAAAGAAPHAAAVDPARTQFSFITGVAATLQEALFGIDRSSPLVTSHPYLDWTVPAVGQATVPRSSVVGTALLGAARATTAERAQFDKEPFLEAEWEVDFISSIFHEYDKVGGLSGVFADERAWGGAIPGLKAKITDLSRDDHPLRPRVGHLLHTESFHGRGAAGRVGPAALNFLAKVQIGQLLRPDDHLAEMDYMPWTLARATSVFASKDKHDL